MTCIVPKLLVVDRDCRERSVGYLGKSSLQPFMIIPLPNFSDPYESHFSGGLDRNLAFQDGSVS